ncbi:MAG: CHC2 zinc finger domain-containing protein, partial [Anaerolineae bacterium]|nr:CHC2 zinc finger domain-containing protein [Anaerolineae bacterium]
MISRDVIETIRKSIPFPALVAETLSLPRYPNGRPVMVHCPFHEDRHPSLAVYDDHAHCFGCGWHGDAFSWLMWRDGITFRDALETLARRTGISLRPLTLEEQRQIQERREYEDALALAARHFAQRLQESPKALEYAGGRWTEETIRNEGIGYADGSLIPSLGNPKAQSVVNALNRWAGKVGGAVVYVHRLGGRVVYLSGRSIEGKEHYNPPIDLAGPRMPYLNVLYSPRVQELVIVEGQACAITLGGWGIPALALAGSGVTQDLAAHIRRHAESGASIYAVPDGDGKTDLDALAQAAGPLLRVVSLPEGTTDVNAFAQSGATAEDFRALMGSAPTWLDREINQASQAQGAERDRAVESLFLLLAEVANRSPVTAARYKGEVLKALPEIRSRDYDRMLKAARQARQTPASAPARILEEDHPILSPALDFVDDLAVVAVTFIAQIDGDAGYRPYLITSQRECIPLDDRQMISVGGITVILRDRPMALPSLARWPWAYVQAYLEGDSPPPVEVYLETRRLLDTYLDFRDDETSDILALWVMGTYLYPLFEAFPYIAIQGPKGSGKTKTLNLLEKLAFNARLASSLSPAVLFRAIHATRGVLCVDEAERLSDPRDPVASDLRLLLNAGYKRGSPAMRCEGDDYRVTEFEVYGPKAIASIRGLEDVLESRCIRISMLRTTGPKGSRVVSEWGENWAQARHGLYCFALQHFSGVREAYQQGAGADGLNNRQGELWRPLLAIAACLEEQGAEGLLRRIREHAWRMAGQAEEEGLDDERRALLLALYRLTGEGHCLVRPKEIREAMASFLEDEEQAGVKTTWVGYRMKEFGFQRKRVQRGSAYRVTREGVLDLMRRYGVEVSDGAGDETAIGWANT